MSSFSLRLNCVCGRRYLDIYSEAVLRGLVFILSLPISANIALHRVKLREVEVMVMGMVESSSGLGN